MMLFCYIITGKEAPSGGEAEPNGGQRSEE